MSSKWREFQLTCTMEYILVNRNRLVCVRDGRETEPHEDHEVTLYPNYGPPFKVAATFLEIKNWLMGEEGDHVQRW